jgi:hypothetical protein
MKKWSLSEAEAHIFLFHLPIFPFVFYFFTDQQIRILGFDGSG